MSLNKVMLIGNVGKDPEIKDLNATRLASFTLATSERYKDANGDTKEITEWHNIRVWGKQADFVEKYVKKGSALFIEGKIRTRSWDDQSGNKRYTTEIMADTLQFVGKRQDSDGPKMESYASEKSVSPQAKVAAVAPSPEPMMPSVDLDPESDDDLPF